MHPLSLLFLPFLTLKKKKNLSLAPLPLLLLPLRLSLLSWVMEHVVPSFRLYELLASSAFSCLPPSCARLQLPFFFSLFRGGMSALNHMISPNDKPSLCKPATQRQGVLCRVMMRHVQEDGDAQKSSLCHV